MQHEQMLMSKRKLPPTSHSQQGDENTQNSPVKRNIGRTDDLCQMESENCLENFQTKVSLGKQPAKNVVGPHEKITKNEEKRKVKMHDTQTMIESIPLDIVQFLDTNQNERHS